jgi:glycosyltransferase involved in cell wall biosynthesis
MHRDLRCLWLARTIPYPTASGDRLYTAGLVTSLASVGARVTFLGFAAADPPGVSEIEWIIVPGRPRRAALAALSRLPLVAARHRTRAYRDAARAAIDQSGRWDAIIVDQYGMGWILDVISRRRHETGPAVVFISHDHEESVTLNLWRRAGVTPLKRAFLFLNYLKTRALERRICQACDVVTAITEDDATQFRRALPTKAIVALTPGYGGAMIEERTISATIPRRALIFGSFQWIAKQINLCEFLEHAQSAFRDRNIGLDIIGSMDDALRSRVQRQYPFLRAFGYVERPADFFGRARLAIVAEPIGGGFKMKLLDYVFHRVPVLALDSCTVGLPPEIKDAIFVAPTLAGVINRVPEIIDDLAALNRSQRAAAQAAKNLFRWEDRGAALSRAICEAQARVSCADGEGRRGVS